MATYEFTEPAIHELAERLEVYFADVTDVDAASIEALIRSHGTRLAKPSGYATRAAADEAYRKALGQGADGELPNSLGQQSSAGAARGGKGASTIGRGKNK
jgi:hypothetical protein